MKCEEARHLIDRRLHDEADGDWSELDAHLATCSACSADWIELIEAWDLLATVADDGPNSEEVETMWSAIAAGMDEQVAMEESPMRWYDWRVALSGVAVAACLLLAFQLGEIRYGKIQTGGVSLAVPEQSATETFGGLCRSGDVTAGQFVCPSSSEPMSLQSDLSRFDDVATEEYGYVYPSPSGSEFPRADVVEIVGKEDAIRRGRGYAAKGIETRSVAGDEVSSVSAGEKYDWYFAGYPTQNVPGEQTKIADSEDLFLGVGLKEGSDERYGSPLVADNDGAARRRLESLGYVSNTPNEVHDGAAVISRGSQVGRNVSEPNLKLHKQELHSQEAACFSTATAATLVQTIESKEDADFGRYRVSARGRESGDSTAGRRMGDDVSYVDDLTSDNRSELSFGLPLQDGGFQSPATGEVPLAEAEETSEDTTVAWAEDVSDYVVARNFVATDAKGAEPTSSQSIEEVQERISPVTSVASQQIKETVPSVQPKIIKTGDLTIEVETYINAAEQVRELVSRFKAFVADASTEELAGGAFRGRIVIRVAPQEFDTLFAALKEVGVVESENAKAADVTAEYVDIDARIRGLKITEARLEEIIRSKSWMDRMSALLEVEREMTRVRSQIEQLEGQLRVMSDRIALSTITVTIHEPSRTVPSATMSVEVPVLAEAASQLGQSLAVMGGKLLAGEVSKQDQGALHGQYRLEVSLARFSEMLDGISRLGRVERRQVKDQTFDGADEPWASRVQCHVDLRLFERSRNLPSGTIRVEVSKLDSALKTLETVSGSVGGSIASSNTIRREDGSSTAEATLLVPAGRFADLVSELDRIGRPLTKRVSGEAGRIVGGTAEVLCTLSVTLAEPVRQIPSGGIGVEVEDFKASRQRLSSIIKNREVQILHSASKQRSDGTWVGGFRLGIEAGEMESVVSEIEQLGRVASRDITGLGLGDLSQIPPGTLGVIELTLGEKSAISPEPDRADSIRNRLRDGLAGLYASVGMIVYGLMLIAPWLFLILPAAWLLGRIWRRLAAKRQQRRATE